MKIGLFYKISLINILYIMKTFYITYITLEGDTETVTVEAFNIEDARKQLKREYWDVREIIRIKDR